MTTFGADFSTRVNAAALRKAGLLFGSTRLTTEPGTIDPVAAPNIADLRQAGLTPGAYAFLVHRNGFGDAAAQARAFMDALGDPTGVLVQLDAERPNFPALHPPATVPDIRLWCATWTAAHPGHPVVLYVPRWWWSAARYSGDLSGLGPLWASWYLDPVPQAPSIAAIYEQVPASYWTAGYGGWKKATLLQFTGTQHIVAGSVDLNATNANLATLTGGDMLGIVTVTPFDKPRTWHVAAGTTLAGYDPTKPGVVVKQIPFPKASSASADAFVKVEWPGAPGGGPSPRGYPFLRVTNGGFAGLLIVAAQVSLDPAPPAPALAPYHVEINVTSTTAPAVTVTKS